MSEEVIYILVGVLFNAILVLLLIVAWRLLSPSRPPQASRPKRTKRRRPAPGVPAAEAATPPSSPAEVKLEGLFRFDSELHRPLADDDVDAPGTEAAAANGRANRMAR